MRIVLLAIFAMLAVAGLCGCQSAQPTAAMEAANPVVPKKPVNLFTRNNSLALLDELLGEEKDVNFILVVKTAPPELKRLVKDIAKTAGQGAKMIKAAEKKDPGLKLAGNGLPPGETAARAGLSKTKEHDLLHSKGPDFELQLLLTQAEALAYGAQLALDVAVNDTQPDRSRQFARFSEQFKLLHGQVVAMLQAKQSSPGDAGKN
jgi:hypothetical protein